MHYGRADLGAMPKMVAGLEDVCHRPRLNNSVYLQANVGTKLRNSGISVFVNLPKVVGYFVRPKIVLDWPSWRSLVIYKLGHI